MDEHKDAKGKLDAKFYGAVFKAKDDSAVPPDEWVVFRPHDDCFAKLLPLYRETCVAAGCDPAHIAAVDVLITKVRRWREAHPERCHRPDIGPDEKLLMG